MKSNRLLVVLCVLVTALLMGQTWSTARAPLSITVIEQDRYSGSGNGPQVFLVFRLWADGTVDCNSVGEEDIGNCPPVIEPECFAGWRVIH